MTEDQTRCFELLKNKADDDAWLLDRLYKCNLDDNKALIDDISRWLENTKALKSIKKISMINRAILERFFESFKMHPVHLAAAHLGMTKDSLLEVIKYKWKLGLCREYLYYRSQNPGTLVDTAINEDLTNVLDNIRYRSFENHDDSCKCLHKALEHNLGFKIEPLLDAGRRQLDGHWHYANCFDCITQEPIHDQVWMDFGKPIYLSPDKCSKRFYAENRDVLVPFIMGSREPEDLEKYLNKPAKQQFG